MLCFFCSVLLFPVGSCCSHFSHCKFTRSRNFLFKLLTSGRTKGSHCVVLCCVGIWLLAGLLALNKILILLDLHFDKSMKWWAIQNAVYGIIVIIQIALKILTCWEIFKTRCNSRPLQSSKHRQITTTVMIMVAVQMFTGFPYVVILQLGHGVIAVNYHLLMDIKTYYSPLVFLNFCVNPIIYFLRLPDYRSLLHSLSGFRKRKNQKSSDP